VNTVLTTEAQLHLVCAIVESNLENARKLISLIVNRVNMGDQPIFPHEIVGDANAVASAMKSLSDVLKKPEPK
jgi:hypothetical protein